MNWILCSERLPEEGEWVLIWEEGGTFHAAALHYFTHVVTGERKYGWDGDDDTGAFRSEHVTHWAEVTPP